MKIVCDNCSTKYSIADEKVRGKVFKIKCKKCSHIIVVKGQEGGAEAPPAGFDQKETRVFDYSGFEGKDGQPAAPGADAIWHLVIDREQVGPLTVAEVASKWAAGEIDADTYAWRDGFADWQRVAAIGELASVTGGGAPAARAPAADDQAGGLFSGDPAQAGRADPTDLFAAAGAGQTSGDEDAGGGDLFGGAKPPAGAMNTDGGVFSSAPQAARRSVPKDDLFGAGGAAEAGAGGGGDLRPMTGQRNENSVLFSLNNLAALATDTPRASGGGGGGGGGGGLGGGGGGATAGQPGYATSGNTEGSGLIDIRAMAAMTLGAAKKEDGPRHSAHDDDLPVFSATAFSAPTAGVLLPTVAPERNNKLVYVFMGVIGFLAVAAIVLVIFIVVGKKTPAAPAGPTAPVIATNDSNAKPPPVETRPTVSSATSSAPAQNTTSSAGQVAPPPTTPTSSAQAAPPTTPVTSSKPEVKRPVVVRPPSDQTSSRARPEVKPVESAAARPPQNTTCDEVACLVTPDLPCCPKKGPKQPVIDNSLPDKIGQQEIIQGMQSVVGGVMGCNSKAPGAGTFKVKVTVAADGSVSNVTAGPPVAGTPAAGCVEGKVRGAHFKKAKGGITFNYPFTFH